MPSAKAQRIGIALIGVLGSAVFMWLAARRLHFATMRSVWATSKPLPWVIFGVLCYIAGQFVRGERLRVLIRRDARLSWLTATNIVVIGYASNNVFPARLGELVRAGVLVDRTGMPFGEALTITFIERLLDGIAILLILVASAFALHEVGWVRDVAKVGGLVFGGALAVLLVGVLRPNALLALASRMSGPLGPNWRDRAFRITTHIINGGACLRSPETALSVSLLSILVWVLEASMFVCILPAFGLALRFSTGALAMSVTNLGILVPSTPGYIGPFHFFCAQALRSQGVPNGIALGYAVLVHLAFYIPVTLWGGVALFRYGVEVFATVAAVRGAQSKPALDTIGDVPVHIIGHVESEPAALAPGAFTVSLTEAVLPASTPELVRDVAAFLDGQIHALPPHLRTLFHLGMTFFRVTTRARTFRSFCALPLLRRRSMVESWAFGQIGLFRQLFRPIRSIALLAYYERPDVVRSLAPEEPQPLLRVLRKGTA
jgi:uncharacterized membrane protein YbhN (UPF0104 family)